MPHPSGESSDQLRTEQSGLESEVANTAQDGRAEMDRIRGLVREGASTALDLLTDLRQLDKKAAYSTSGPTIEHRANIAGNASFEIDRAISALIRISIRLNPDTPMVDVLGDDLQSLLNSLLPYLENPSDIVIGIFLGKMIGTSDSDSADFLDEQIALFFTSDAVTDWPKRHRDITRSTCEGLIRNFRQRLNDAKNVPDQPATKTHEQL